MNLEQYHRYRWSAALVEGRRVLDLGGGHPVLAEAAASVEALNTSLSADLERIEPGYFDAVLMFDALDRADDRERLLEQAERVLAADGLLIVSASIVGQTALRTLLGRRFAHVGLWGQRTVSGSRIATLDGAGGPRRSEYAERFGEDWVPSHERSPSQLIGVAARVPFEPPPAEAYMGTAELADAEDRLVAQLAARTAEVAASNAEVARTNAETAGVRRELARINESVTWKLIQRGRTVVYRVLGGRDSAPARALQWSLRRAGRLVMGAPPPRPGAGNAAAAAIAPIEFPDVSRPVATIIIPVHARADLTEACLRSIVEHTDGPPYEVVVVDDRAGSEHRPVWDAIRNARVIHNDTQQGYLRNNNLAAREARGRYLVLLNNDTEVRRGWLRALVARVESADDVGVVVPKLLYPNGSLQEAGGIIFSDGTGWNFGRLQDPARPEFNYVREVDYGSGAALLVRTDLWQRLGGFDERYLPMYYEDTDLCFAARDAGFRVLYEPRAEVVHVEGATAGTDITASSKRFQEINRPKFAEKWREQLAEQAPSGDPTIVRRVSDRNRGPHVLIVDHRVPTPDRDSGSVRMVQILQALRELGCRVTFLPDNLDLYEPYGTQLQSMGVEVLYGSLELNAEIATIAPNLRLAIVSRPYVAPRFLHMIRRHAPATRIVYDSVDLHYVRERRQAELEGRTDFGVADSFREIEHGIMRAVDVTAVVTEEEKVEVERAIEGIEAVVLPNANPVVEQAPAPDGRTGLLFVGGFEHTPNIDAALWLVESIMPRVRRELGDVPVAIVGADPPPEVLALAGDGVEVLGWVKDLDPLIDGARMTVAPLRFGAGMKGKVTQSLAVGLPVVTTSIGAEGLGAEDGRDLLIADDADGFAERIVSLYRDDARWAQLSAAGRALAERVCSPAVVRERLRALLD